MATLSSSINTQSDEFKAKSDAMQVLVDDLQCQVGSWKDATAPPNRCSA